MNSVLHVVDLVSLAVMWWCSAAALAGGHVVLRWRDLAMSVGLLCVMVFSFCGFAYLWETGAKSVWWSTGIRAGGALIMGALYEYRFGIARHLRMARDWAIRLPANLAVRLASLRRQWKGHA